MHFRLEKQPSQKSHELKGYPDEELFGIWGKGAHTAVVRSVMSMVGV